jgi:hypothetical protein
MAPVLKTGVPERVPGVRIPPSPPLPFKSYRPCSPRLVALSGLTELSTQHHVANALTSGEQHVLAFVRPTETGLLDGRVLTSWLGVRDDLVNAGAKWLDQEVVWDRNLVTSRGPQDMVPFGAIVFSMRRDDCKLPASR